jgi:hypothetical protein
MQRVDLTFLRAFKVWWSISWRAIVLWWPFAIASVLSARGVLHAGPHVTPPAPAEFGHHMARLWVVWLPFFVAAVIVHAFAIRWALRRARWSDFRLQAVADDQSTPAT